MESDREHAAKVLAEYRHLRNSNLADSVLDAMLEFAAQEVEREPVMCAERAAQLRAQKESNAIPTREEREEKKRRWKDAEWIRPNDALWMFDSIDTLKQRLSEAEAKAHYWETSSDKWHSALAAAEAPNYKAEDQSYREKIHRELTAEKRECAMLRLSCEALAVKLAAAEEKLKLKDSFPCAACRDAGYTQGCRNFGDCELAVARKEGKT